jgi:hypothetical protein
MRMKVRMKVRLISIFTIHTLYWSTGGSEVLESWIHPPPRIITTTAMTTTIPGNEVMAAADKI